MPGFRNITIGRMLYETLRNYFSVNAAGELSILYQYLICILLPIQSPFDAYQVFRTREALIASCKWQIGQLTNVLNYLYDTTLKRIFITQSKVSAVSLTMFQYAPLRTSRVFGEAPGLQLRTFTDRVNETVVTINVPAGVNLSDLKAVVEQIRIQGIPYQIATI